MTTMNNIVVMAYFAVIMATIICLALQVGVHSTISY